MCFLLIVGVVLRTKCTGWLASELANSPKYQIVLFDVLMPVREV